MRSRKLRRIEANELRNVGVRLGFPGSRKPAPATNAELDRDFEVMGVRASNKGIICTGERSDTEHVFYCPFLSLAACSTSTITITGACGA